MLHIGRLLYHLVFSPVLEAKVWEHQLTTLEAASAFNAIFAVLLLRRWRRCEKEQPELPYPQPFHFWKIILLQIIYVLIDPKKRWLSCCIAGLHSSTWPALNSCLQFHKFCIDPLASSTKESASWLTLCASRYYTSGIGTYPTSHRVHLACMQRLCWGAGPKLTRDPPVHHPPYL